MSEKMVEYIAEACNLYISDIRLSESSATILPVVRRLDPNLFSSEDWSTSLSYIFMRSLHFDTAEDAKNYYIQRLKKFTEDDES
ncbi:hypothetical protein [Caproiciproducens galactitolivorans]|uniref:Uncharacterized protein n=1 Tax=Caproiciproducens galactitolivorans TaxID=642589 RepID=A0ABT4BU25_9FIRM|nr:hypothetical protein [Caproiciproducens galactitolivorans]MCY1714409.1 hypothetical protein [Caproiciproducens galactitolivorans]